MKSAILSIYIIFTLLFSILISNTITFIKTNGKQIHFFDEKEQELDYRFAKENIINFNPQYKYYQSVKTNTEVTPRLLKFPFVNIDTVSMTYLHDNK